jgi:hypothetical protein
MKFGPTHSSRGYLTLFVLLFAVTFMALVADLANYLLADQKLEHAENARAIAFSAADAGIQYYLWHLNALPGSITDSGAHDVTGPEGNTDASFSVSPSAVTVCGERSMFTVTSVGTSNADPSYPQTITATYAKPTIFASSSPNISLAAPDFTALSEAGGLSLPYSHVYGYRIVLNDDESFDVSPVTAVKNVWGYSDQTGWKTERSVIDTVGGSTHYSVPSDCPVIFVADSVWVEGATDSKLTIAAANIGSTTDANIYIPDNVTYANPRGNGLTLVSQGSVLITLDSPDTLKIQAGLIAVNGMAGRHEYLASGAHAVPAELTSYVLRNSLSLIGASVASFGTTTKWMDGAEFNSGYQNRTDIFDRMLVSNPPPMTPTGSDTIEVVDWRQ